VVFLIVPARRQVIFGLYNQRAVYCKSASTIKCLIILLNSQVPALAGNIGMALSTGSIYLLLTY